MEVTIPVADLIDSSNVEKAPLLIIEELQARELAPQLSAEWFRLRELMFSATDIAALLGYDPYKKYDKIIAKKVDPSSDSFKGNAFTEHGRRYEEIVKQWYEMDTKEEVASLGLLRHPEHEFIGASPDGIGVQSLHLVEIKSPVRRGIVRGEVPQQYIPQIQTQLQVTGMKTCQYAEAVIKETHGIFDQGDFDGIVRGIPEGSTWKYQYAPRGLSYEKCRKWWQTQSAPWNVQYWSYKVVEYQRVQVDRDDEWWREIAMPVLHRAWSDVQRFRAEPHLMKAKKPRVKRRDLEDVGDDVGDQCLFGTSTSTVPVATKVASESSDSTMDVSDVQEVCLFGSNSQGSERAQVSTSVPKHQPVCMFGLHQSV
jgi:putative phage-type endonuclease